jgi:hypothetical protein
LSYSYKDPADSSNQSREKLSNSTRSVPLCLKDGRAANRQFIPAKSVCYRERRGCLPAEALTPDSSLPVKRIGAKIFIREPVQ